ncbi:hypothetical protein C8Q77DRAFT_515362 [Trametes polyzona]|nr:hypothetical protein C8Q77DRAFT_515362 [Trametes polyzona]
MPIFLAASASVLCHRAQTSLDPQHRHRLAMRIVRMSIARDAVEHTPTHAHRAAHATRRANASQPSVIAVYPSPTGHMRPVALIHHPSAFPFPARGGPRVSEQLRAPARTGAVRRDHPHRTSWSLVVLSLARSSDRASAFGGYPAQPCDGRGAAGCPCLGGIFTVPCCARRFLWGWRVAGSGWKRCIGPLAVAAGRLPQARQNAQLWMWVRPDLRYLIPAGRRWTLSVSFGLVNM